MSISRSGPLSLACHCASFSATSEPCRFSCPRAAPTTTHQRLSSSSSFGRRGPHWQSKSACISVSMFIWPYLLLATCYLHVASGTIQAASHSYKQDDHLMLTQENSSNHTRMPRPCSPPPSEAGPSPCADAGATGAASRPRTRTQTSGSLRQATRMPTRHRPVSRP